jgi:hypothetical protein
MIFKKKQEPAETTPEETAENPFTEAAEELLALEQANELPEGFELKTAAADPAFAGLLAEFEPKAAVRIYVAERRADEAEETAKTRMSEQARTRSALPKSQRTDRAVAPAPDYMSMSREAFRALEQQYRNASHNGKRVHI